MVLKPPRCVDEGCGKSFIVAVPARPARSLLLLLLAPARTTAVCYTQRTNQRLTLCLF